MRRNRYILAGLLSVLPVAFWPGSTSYEAAKFLVVALAVGGFFCAAAVKIWRRQQLALPSAKIFFCLLAIVLVIIGSGLVSNSPWLSLRVSVLVAAAIIVWWAACSSIQTESQLKLLLCALVVGGCVTSLYGLAQLGGVLPGADPSLGVPVGISTFGNENQMSGYAALVMWPALALLVLARTTKERVAASLASMVLLSAVFFAEASGPQMATSVALVVISLGWMFARLKAGLYVPRALQVTMGIGAAMVVVVFFRILEPQAWSDFPLPDAVSRLLAANNGDVRRTDWLVAWHLFKSSSFLGVGAGGYQVHWLDARAALTTQGAFESLAVYTPIATRAHNDFLQLMAEMGLAGVAIIGIGAAMLMRGLSRTWARLCDSRLALAWLTLCGAVVMVAVHALVSFPLHLPAPGLAMAGIVGVLAAPVFCAKKREARPKKVPHKLFWLPVVFGLFVAGLGVREFVADLNTARGERAYAAGQFSTAAIELERGVENMIWPERGDLYLGLTLVALGQPEEAETRFVESMGHHPSFEALLALAEIEIDRQEYAEALVRLNLVDGCEPTESFRRRSRYLRSMARLRQGDLVRARVGFVGLLQDEPRDYRTLLALGYLAVLEDKKSEAQAHYRRALGVIDEKLLVVIERGERVRLLKVRVAAERAVGSVK